MANEATRGQPELSNSRRGNLDTIHLRRFSPREWRAWFCQGKPLRARPACSPYGRISCEGDGGQARITFFALTRLDYELAEKAHRALIDAKKLRFLF